jgi:hypothetical protein
MHTMHARPGGNSGGSFLQQQQQQQQQYSPTTPSASYQPCRLLDIM